MTKEEIGNRLAELRSGKDVNCGLSRYSIRSIEESRSSYPVSNLIMLCETLGVQLLVRDNNTGEEYPVDSVGECHSVIEWLMGRYDIDEKVVYRLTGTHYTPPKGSMSPLSINTLVDVCSVLKCDLDLIVIK